MVFHFLLSKLCDQNWSFIYLSIRLEVRIENTLFHDYRLSGNWTYSSSSYDIALLKLAQEVDITVYTPVCLPTLGQDYLSPDSRGNYRWGTATGKEGKGDKNASMQYRCAAGCPLILAIPVAKLCQGVFSEGYRRYLALCLTSSVS